MTAQTKTVLKSYFETGDRPTEQQFADLIDSIPGDAGVLSESEIPATIARDTEVTAAVSAHAAASDPHGDRAYADAAAAARKTLSDYRNVVVVDDGGSGDYTTLAAAMAAITDASSSKRYAVYCFGRLTLTEDTTIKQYCDLTGPGTIDCGAYTLTFQSTEAVNVCRVARIENAQGIRPDAAGMGVDLVGVYCAFNSGTWTSGGIVSFKNCVLDPGIGLATLTLSGNSQVNVYNCSSGLFGDGLAITLSGSTVFSAFNSTLGRLTIAASTIVVNVWNCCFTTTTYALYVTAASAPTAANVEIVNCGFEGAGGSAARCVNFTWNPAQIYNCVFRGAVTQITLGSSNVTF